jgi:hypothetical protein
MVKDPAMYAVEHELIDKHEPEVIRKIGAWRWPAIQNHQQLILERITDRRTLDFGGAAGGIGYGAVVVDYGVANKALYDVSGWFSTIFTSHTLEHVVDLPLALENFAPGAGKLQLEARERRVCHRPRPELAQ